MMHRWQFSGRCTGGSSGDSAVGAALQEAVGHRAKGARGQDSQTAVEHLYREGGSIAGAAENLLVSTALDLCEHEL